MNGFRPFTRPLSAISETRKAISFQRIELIGQAIDRYNVVNARLPERLDELSPNFISSSLLSDPWGNAYKYIPRPERYLVIGFAPDGKVDTDLFLSRTIDFGTSTPGPARTETGTIQLLDER
jgi:hypothetical protein